MRRGKTIWLAALTVALAPAAMCMAGVIMPTTEFAGDYTETWESFPNYTSTPGAFLGPATDIFGQNAELQGSNLAIYERGTAPFNLDVGVTADIFDGVRGLGVSSSSSITNIVFDDGLNITMFGGYWGAAMSSAVTLTFFDANDVEIGSDMFSYNAIVAQGTLEWQGWESSQVIKRVQIEGDFVVLDGVRASVTAIPGPGSLALIAVASVLAGGRRRRH